MSLGNLHLLVSPASGGGRAARVAPEVTTILVDAGFDVRVDTTSSIEHARELGAQAGPDTVVAALGGDGFIGAVASGVVDSGAVLAPLPGGSGNDFCRVIGMTRDPLTDARALAGAPERRIDVGQVDGHRFLGVATVGFDTESNRRANETTWLRSQAVYLYAAAWTALTFKPVRLRITVDGEQREMSVWNTVVANSGMYGGGMRICPMSRLDDGLLDCLSVAEAPRWRFLTSMPKVFKGTHVHDPAVSVRRGATVRFDCDQELEVYADGDLISTTPATISVLPGALRLKAPVPPGCDAFVD